MIISKVSKAAINKFTRVMYIYIIAVRPAVMLGLETVRPTGGQEAGGEVMELRMIRLAMRVTRMGWNRMKYINRNRKELE